MQKKKFNIYNIEIDNTDLYLMKEFIDMYDDCNEKFKEYNKLINNIRKEEKLKEKENLTESIEKILNNIIKKMMDCKDKQSLEQLKNEYKKYSEQLKEIKKYDPIVKIYNEMYATDLSQYFDNKNTEQEIEYNTRKKYKSYSEEELKEQIKIEKEKYKKRQTSTITRIYINTKYLYEICSKIYEIKQKEVENHGLIAMIKNKIQKVKLKKTIKEINQEYVKDNEIFLAQVKADENIYIDMESLEQNIEFFKMFKDPMEKYIINKSKQIQEARKEAEKQPEEIQLSEKVTLITRKEQIENLKKVKEELTCPEEIIITTKTA